MYGIVKEFNSEKGYGFISNEVNNNIFFHYTELVDRKCKVLKPGDTVNFILDRNRKEYKAKRIIKVTSQLKK